MAWMYMRVAQMHGSATVGTHRSEAQFHTRQQRLQLRAE